MRRFLSFVLVLCLILSVAGAEMLTAQAEDWKQYLEGATWITDPAEARGSDYTDHPYLAEKLDAIFAGNAQIYEDYECTELHNTALGTNSVPNWGELLCVPGGQRGWSCYIYANGVYYALFGECPGDGDNVYHRSEALPGVSGEPEELCALLREAGVTTTGAYCRTGSHSFVILNYDEDGIALLDGNSINGGNGLVQVTEATWEYFYTYFLADGTNPIDHIVQPTQGCLNALALRARVSAGENHTALYKK